MSLAALLLAVGTMFSWGLTWVLMRAGVRRMSMVSFGLLRPWMGLPLIGLYAAATGGAAFGSIGLSLLAFATGILNAFVGTWLFYYALRHGPMHEVNILANINPLWGVVSAIVLLGERGRPVTLLAGVLVVAGSSILVRKGKGQDRARSIPALLAALGAGLAWGFTAAVPTKHCLNEGMSPVGFQVLFTAGAAVAWLVPALPLLLRGKLVLERGGVWLALLSSAFGMFLGWVLWLMALERAPASVLSPMVGLVLLFATVLGVVFLKERLPRRTLVGGLLVLAGVTLVSALPG